MSNSVLARLDELNDQSTTGIPDCVQKWAVPPSFFTFVERLSSNSFTYQCVHCFRANEEEGDGARWTIYSCTFKTRDNLTSHVKVRPIE